MGRLQLALNVENRDEAVEFYSKLFDAKPNKIEPGYANFALSDPPLKLVLIENPGGDERLNHLGVEVETSQEVNDAHARLTASELDAAAGENVECCFALKDETWVHDPDGAAWEIYTVLADVPSGKGSATPARAGTASITDSEDASAGACCCG